MNMIPKLNYEKAYKYIDDLSLLIPDIVPYSSLF